VAARLAEACGHPSHAFWPQQISLLQEGLIRWERSADGGNQLDHDLPCEIAA
jgi:hypothetical protein